MAKVAQLIQKSFENPWLHRRLNLVGCGLSAREESFAQP